MKDLNPVHTMNTSGAIKNRDGKLIGVYIDFMLETSVGTFFCANTEAAMNMIAELDSEFKLGERS